MSENELERAKNLAERLSPEDRLQLFQHLAELPDSGIETLQRPSLAKPRHDGRGDAADESGGGQAAPAPQPNFTLNYTCRIENDDIIYYLEGVEVFRVTFRTENCTNVFFEKLKSNDSFLTLSPAQRDKVYAAVREVLAEQGAEVGDEQIKEYEGEALRQLALRLLKESIEYSTKRVRDNLPQAVVMVFEKIVPAAYFSGANELRETLQVPEQKYSAKEVRDALFQSDWERLRVILGIGPGGARNIKHVWTDVERDCLATNYERLKPIWAEAKRIAVAAQKSKEATRSLRWHEAVNATYPDLPADLVERLSAPRSAEARPADIALTHAARLCVPVSYSVRRLRDEIKARKFKNAR